MPRTHVLILHNQPILPRDHPDAASEYEVVETAEAVHKILRKSGCNVTRAGVGLNFYELIEQVHSEQPDVVFNLFEGLGSFAPTEATVAGMLEWLEIPFTGSTALAMTLANDKYRMKVMLRGAGLPTADFFLVEQLPCPRSHLHWPVIVKPAVQDASIGIEQASVVTNQRRLSQQVSQVLKEYGPPVLVEEFVRGREFHVGVIEGPPDARGVPALTVLPLAEIVFLEKDTKYWPIYSYSAKWRTQSREYINTPLHSPVYLEPELNKRLFEMARRAYLLSGCRDYARIDVRMDENNQFYILEVNPNPFINSLAMINGLKAIDRTMEGFITGLVRNALLRKAKAEASVAVVPPTSPTRERTRRLTESSTAAIS
jgi:D-alanine-D-alanine ligase